MSLRVIYYEVSISINSFHKKQTQLVLQLKNILLKSLIPIWEKLEDSDQKYKTTIICKITLQSNIVIAI